MGVKLAALEAGSCELMHELEFEKFAIGQNVYSGDEVGLAVVGFASTCNIHFDSIQLEVKFAWPKSSDPLEHA